MAQATKHPRTSHGRRWLAVAALAGMAAAVVPAAAAGAQTDPTTGVEAGLDPNVIAGLEALEAEKASRTPAERKVDSQLLRTSRESTAGVSLNSELPQLRNDIVVEGGRTLVDIEASVNDSLLDAIENSGGTVVSALAEYDAIRAEVVPEAIVDLAARSDVTFIGPAAEATTNQDDGDAIASSVGAGANEADLTHAAASARSTFGVDGTGVKACVLSDGVDTIGARQASGDLPAIDVLPGQAGSGDEGTAMLELIHDIAPGAQLGFATGFSGTAQFAANIIALEASGCTVIVDDITYFTEPSYQDGPIAQAVSTVRASGSVYFTSAGNSGNAPDGTSGTWQGDFDNEFSSTAPIPAGLFRVHGWGQTGQPYNTITRNSSRTDLQWADPMGGSGNDYALVVLNNAGTQIVAASDNIQDGDDDPLEAVGETFVGERVMVVRRNADANRYLSVYTNRGRLSIGTGGASRGHNVSVDAVSVAATPASVAASGGPTGPFPNPHTNVNTSETFSSDGPTKQFFTPSGVAVTPGNFSSSGGISRNGLDITAADGVTTTTPGFSRFYGTSAAAPNAAALAVLAKQLRPNLTPGQIEAGLNASAIDIEAPGVDPVTGAGIVMAPGLLSYVQGLSGPAGSVYIPQTPCRVVDTRGHGEAFGNREIRNYSITGSGSVFASQGGKANGCGIPDNAVAVEASISAVSPATSGFTRAYPGNQSTPNATFMNFAQNQDITNTGAIALASSGSIDLKLRNYGGASQYVIDIQGYYMDQTQAPGAVYVAQTPCRVVDTRGHGEAFGNREIRNYSITGSGSVFANQGGKANGCGIPDNALAVEASISSVSPATSGFTRAYPGNQSTPNATFMNFAQNQDITNTGSVSLANNGTIDLKLRNYGGASQYVIDIQGYYIDPNLANGAIYVPQTPCRVVDTRGHGEAFGNREIRNYSITGSGSVFANQGGKNGGCGIPNNAVAVEASISAVSPATSGFTRAYPGNQSTPNATFMNFAQNQDITNTGSVSLANNGTIDLKLRNYGGASQYVIDIQGYYIEAI